jgi:oligogalacturonide lyase
MQSEKRTYTDRASGVEVTQLTDHKGHSHHFYVTNAGWYADGRKLLFASDRNNRTNLFGVELESGEIEQLTDLEPVPLPREVEFLRACKNPVREEVYFWHDLKLLACSTTSRCWNSSSTTACRPSPAWPFRHRHPGISKQRRMAAWRRCGD